MGKGLTAVALGFAIFVTAPAVGALPEPNYGAVRRALAQQNVYAVVNEGDVAYRNYESRMYSLFVDQPPQSDEPDNDGYFNVYAYSSRATRDRGLRVMKQYADEAQFLIVWKWRSSALLTLDETASPATISRMVKAVKALPGKSKIVLDRR